MCPGSSIVNPSSKWVWSTLPAAPSPSCSAPSAQNVGQMCSGDPTSIVMSSHGHTGCFVTRMPACKFSMYELKQLDFDVRLVGCSGTWAAPLWLTPDYWAGGGKSGEIDMVELCPTHSVSSNFAGASAPVGYQKTWKVADPNSFSGHVTMWNTNGDITVKMCKKSTASSNGGNCPGDGAAYYPNVFASHACADGDCIFQFVSDIWNGLSGDGGYWGCTGGAPPSTKSCRFSVRKIRVKGPKFSGNCAALNTRRRRRSTPRRRSSPRRRTTRRRRSSWSPCGPTSNVCCDPSAATQQYCPNGQACKACGAAACECPSSTAFEV